MPWNENMVITAYMCLWLAVLGAVLGSFLDCAVSRWAAGEPWHRGRSRCISCGHPLVARDLVPVASYLLRRGRCRFCGRKIPAECLLAELAGAGAFLCLGLRFGLRPALGQWLVWAGLLLALSLWDAAEQIIPDSLLLALYMGWAELLLGLLLSCLLGLLWAALAGRRRDAAVPFGPFLAAGAVSAVCFGGPVIRWYFSLF